MEDITCVHVYTGNGKGKTTAALGLIVRAIGAGLSVLLVQFLKREEYSEHDALKLLADKVTVTDDEACRTKRTTPLLAPFGRVRRSPAYRTFGGERRIGAPVSEEDRARARQGLECLKEALTSGEYDLVIADEIVVAAQIGAISEEDIFELLDARAPSVEFVLTGRGASQALIERADLVTEMREERHYFAQGVPARRGIER